MNLFRFASEELETTITPAPLFEIFGIPVTNSIFYGWIISITLIILLVLGAKKIKIGGTRGPSEIIELISEFMVNLAKSTIGNDKLAIKYAPIFATMFVFILVNNWLGLIPGVGHSVEYDGNPLLRPFTADLNGTIAMALFGMVLIQVIAIKESGMSRHLKHYFPGKLYNPVTYLIGAFEIFTEFTRLLSLGLRLFLNIAIGEILIAVAAFLGANLAPIAALPFTLLELFVGVLQAFIFVVLCMAYLSATISHSEHGENQEVHA